MCDRKLREIFNSMDVNDSGTVKLGEVRTFLHQVFWEIHQNEYEFFISRPGWCCSRAQCATMCLFQICSVWWISPVMFAYYTFIAFNRFVFWHFKKDKRIMYSPCRNLQDLRRIFGERWSNRIANQFRAILRSSQRVFVDADEE